jgi:arsenate reductase
VKKALFVCIHNSARSQMAEAFCNDLSQGRMQAQSAGIEPGKLNLLVVKAMAEAGLDISSHMTKSVRQFIESGERFDYIITVCDETSAERCPVFPGGGQRLHFGFEDPSELKGDDEAKLKKIRVIRDQIKAKIGQWLKEPGII